MKDFAEALAKPGIVEDRVDSDGQAADRVDSDGEPSQGHVAGRDPANSQSEADAEISRIFQGVD
jgi:hypothetical protein